MRHLKLLAWALLLVFLSYSSPTFSEPFESKTVAEVIDGDTVVFSSGEHARLIGIDTPERDQLFYDEAKEFLRNTLSDPNVTIEFDKDKRDRYGRLLIYLYLPDGTNVNDLLVENGLAKLYFFLPNLAHRDRLISILQGAIDSRLGLWANEPEGNEPYYVGDPNTLLFHKPGDKIVKKIKDPVIFNTRFDAFRAGYGIHRPCNP